MKCLSDTAIVSGPSAGAVRAPSEVLHSPGSAFCGICGSRLWVEPLEAVAARREAETQAA